MREMNLLPEEHLCELEQKRKRKIYIIWILFIMFCIIGSYLSVYLIEYNMRRDISSIKFKIENLEKVSDTQIEISINQDILNNRITMLEIIENKRVDHYAFINELEKTLPYEITLGNLTHPSGKYFKIKGTTTKPDRIADLMVNISRIEGVENVFLDNIHFGNKEKQQENILDFNIYFTYPAKKGGEKNGSN